MPPPPRVLRAFGASTSPHPLDGGRGRTWRADGIVLKPVDLAAESRWRAEILDSLPDNDHFRIARPVRAVTGDWLHDGWEAARHVAGCTDPARWNDAIAAGSAFHAAIALVARPAFLSHRDDRWSRADRAAWCGPVADGPGILRRLMEIRVPIEREHQLVHGDLLGNILFEPGLTPAIIDWAPYWRPVAWAVPVAVVDAMWHGADKTIIDRWSDSGEWPQMLVRALLFRMLTDREADGEAWEPHPAYHPVAEALIDRARTGR